jgi:hypothetical protein
VLEARAAQPSRSDVLWRARIPRIPHRKDGRDGAADDLVRLPAPPAHERARRNAAQRGV